MNDTAESEAGQTAGFVLVEINDLQTSSESDITSESSVSELSSSFLEHSDSEHEEDESDNTDSILSGNFQSFDWRSTNTPSAVCHV